MNAATSSAPLVAVVTPVYNGAKFLAETMECVQALTYPNLVHVVLDNCSTDETAAIIDRYRNGRVGILSTRSTATIPMAQNWNAALQLIPSQAKYFWLLCADDLLTADSITKLVEVAERDRSVSAVGCQWTAETLNGTELSPDRSIFDGKEMLRMYLRRETMVLSGMNVLFRVSALNRDTPFYDTTLTFFDADATLRTLTAGNYGFVHEELLMWRQHPDGTWASVGAKHLDYTADWLILLDRYGPYVLGHREYLHCRHVYRSYFLRRLLLRYWKNNEVDEYSRYVEELRAHGDHAGVLDFVSAIIDWGTYAARGRRDQIGAPWRQVTAIKGTGIAHRRPRI